MHDLEVELSKLDKFAIYCAGEFASLLVRYCASIGIHDNIVCCIVTERDPYTPAHILGIPVLEFKDFDEEKNIPICITLLSENPRREIQMLLSEHGYDNQLVLDNSDFRRLNKLEADFSADIKCELRRLTVKNDLLALKLEKKISDLTMLVHSMQMVAEVHSRSFGEYRGINQGKSIVICGAGKSLNLYSFDDEYIHIGCNSTGLVHPEKLDYFFIQHIPGESKLFYNVAPNFISPDIRKEYLRILKELKCVKFVGQAVGEEWFINPPVGDFYEGDIRPYFFSRDIEGTHYYCKDIRYGLLYAQDSIIFPAIQFALFTNPDKIYLVGCDGYGKKDNYADNVHDKMVNKLVACSDIIPDKNTFYDSVNEVMCKRFEELHDFVQMCYPSTEIVMVNPQRYSGIFKETFTDANGDILD